MGKFQCVSCGMCCREIKTLSDEEKAKTISAEPGLARLPNSDGILLFDWEKDRMEELGAEHRVSLNIVPNAIAVSYRNQPIVMTWSMAVDACPFLSEDNKCRIYSERPLVCRMWPIRETGVSSILYGAQTLKFNFSSDCPGTASVGSFTAMGKLKESAKLFYETFGRSYIDALRYDFSMDYVLAYWMKRLAQAGKIVPVVLSEKQSMKMLAKGHARLVDFVIRNGLSTPDEIKKDLMELDKAAEELVLNQP